MHRHIPPDPMRTITHSFLSFASLFAAGLCVAQERDGQFRATEVAADAKWFAHVDLTALRDSAIGKELLAQIDGEAQRKIKAFKRMISFNPIEDLDAVTVFGAGAEPDKAVALVRGVFDVEHLTDLAMAADGYKGAAHRGKTVHSWTDAKSPGGRLYGCMVSTKIMVLGPDEDLVHAAIALAEGSGTSLEDGGTFALPDGGEGRPIVAAAADLAGLGGLDIESAFARRVRSVYLAAGETDGKVFARAVVGTEDERAPKLLGKMLHGVLAFAEATEGVPVGTSDAVGVTTEGERLEVEASMGVAAFMEMMQGLEDLKGKL